MEAPRKTARERGLLLAALAFLGLGLWLWIRSRPESLEAAARRLNGCVIRGDENCVAEYVWEHEREALGLSKAKLRRYLQEIVLPNLEGWRPVGGPGFLRSEQQGLLLVHQEFQDSQGRRANFSVDVFMTSDGPKADLVAGTLFRSFTTRFYIEGSELSGPARQNVSWYLGLLAQRRKLERIGLKGFVSSKPGEGLRMWGDFLARTRTVLADYKVDPRKYERLVTTKGE